jgi:hypothetical protein
LNAQQEKTLPLDIEAAEQRLKRANEELHQLTGVAGCATRAPKPWVGLSIEEKLERLREQVKEVQQAQRYAFGRISDVQRQVGRLNGHTHDTMGRAVIGIYDEPGLNECGQPVTADDPAKAYF